MTLTVYESIEQGSEEWVQARAGIVTASTVGRLLTSTGKVANNDTSRAFTETLAAERLTGRVEYVHPTADMARGTLLESFARAIYAEHYAPVTEIGFARFDTDAYVIGASPDGLVGVDGGLEIKSPRAKNHLRTVIQDVVPAQHIPQVQASMFVTGRAWWDFASYCPGMPLYVKRVYPDPHWHASIRDAVELFEIHTHDLMHDFEANTQGMPETDYFDPFEQEEIF